MTPFYKSAYNGKLEVESAGKNGINEWKIGQFSMNNSATKKCSKVVQNLSKTSISHKIHLMKVEKNRNWKIVDGFFCRHL